MSGATRLVRFLAGVQRRPVVSILCVVGAILLMGFVFRELGTDDSGFAWVFLSTCLATASAEIGARATSLWARLVIVGIGSGSTWPVLHLVLDKAKNDLWLVALVALMVAVPHAVATAAARTRRPMNCVVALVLAFAASGLPAIAEALKNSNRNMGIVCLLGWVLAVQAAFLAAARSSVSIRSIVASAIALGAASGVERAVAASKSQDVFESGSWTALAWFAGALLVPLARLGGSFTAVPEDHPIRADFTRGGSA